MNLSAHRIFKCMGTNFTFTDAREQTVKGSSCAAKDRTGEETQHSWSSALCVTSDWMNLLWKFKAEILPAEKQGSQFEVVLFGVSALKSLVSGDKRTEEIWTVYNSEMMCKNGRTCILLCCSEHTFTLKRERRQWNNRLLNQTGQWGKHYLRVCYNTWAITLHNS